MLDPEQLYYDGKLWGAKDHKFWCLLSTLLLKCKPKSILELGAGRSTTFFAEYAYESDIPFVSIEESPIWYAEIYRDLRLMFLPGTYIRHVPVDPATDWYDSEHADNAMDVTPYDLVMIDGPTGRGKRDYRGNMIVERAIRKARIIIIDDTQRADCRAFSKHLASTKGFTEIHIPYMQRRRGATTGSVAYDENTVTILTSEWSDIISLTVSNIYGN